jgi:hypothetical protein
MQHNSRRELSGRVLPRSRRVTALLAATGLSIAVAACGSSSPSSSTASSVSASNASASTTGSGVARATTALKAYQGAPTKINITTPLKSAPPPGKTVAVLGTPLPQNVQIQQTVAQLAHLAHWNYVLVSYDPANPATFSSAIDTALTKHANYIVEAGIPVTPALLQKVEQAGAKLAVTAVYPIAVKPPVIANTSADNSTQGNLIADYFVSNSNGKGNAVIERVHGEGQGLMPRVHHHDDEREPPRACRRSASPNSHIGAEAKSIGKLRRVRRRAVCNRHYVSARCRRPVQGQGYR